MKLRTPFIVAIALSFSACAGKTVATEDMFPNNPSLGIIDNFKIAEEEIPVVEKEALYGDADSALRMFQYNEYVKRDKNEARYWLLMAAQNGSKPAMKKLGDMMQADNNNYRNYLRSNYWLKRSGS